MIQASETGWLSLPPGQHLAFLPVASSSALASQSYFSSPSCCFYLQSFFPLYLYAPHLFQTIPDFHRVNQYLVHLCDQQSTLTCFNICNLFVLLPKPTQTLLRDPVTMKVTCEDLLFTEVNVEDWHVLSVISWSNNKLRLQGKKKHKVKVKSLSFMVSVFFLLNCCHADERPTRDTLICVMT